MAQEVPYVDPIEIPAEERESARQQILVQIRRKYLMFKAEWLTGQAITDDNKVKLNKKMMDDTVLAYRKVEVEL